MIWFWRYEFEFDSLNNQAEGHPLFRSAFINIYNRLVGHLSNNGLFYTWIPLTNDIYSAQQRLQDDCQCLTALWIEFRPHWTHPLNIFKNLNNFFSRSVRKQRRRRVRERQFLSVGAQERPSQWQQSATTAVWNIQQSSGRKQVHHGHETVEV